MSEDAKASGPVIRQVAGDNPRSEEGKPDLFDKQLSGTANFRVRDLTLDPGSKVSKEASYVDLLV